MADVSNNGIPETPPMEDPILPDSYEPEPIEKPAEPIKEPEPEPNHTPEPMPKLEPKPRF